MLITKEHPKAKDCRILLNGEDVTERSFLADDVHGVVGLFKTVDNNWPGPFYSEECCDKPGAVTLGAASEYVHGQVVIDFSNAEATD